MKSKLFHAYLRLFPILLGIAISFAFGLTTSADTTVVPLGYGQREGEGNLPMFSSDTRGVYVYDSTLFSDFPLDGGFITGLAVRLDAASISRDELVELELRMGVTQRQISQIQFPGRYEQVTGPSDQVVVPRSTFHFRSSPRPGGINSFDLKISFDSNLFYYNPTSGNLVLDIRTFRGQNFLIDMPTGDGTRRLNGSLGSETPGGFGNGPVTFFEFIPVPEPSQIALMGFAFLIFIFFRRLK